MNQRQRPTYLVVAKGAQPSGPRAWVMINPRSDRLNHENVSESGNDRLAAGPESLCLNGQQTERLSSHSVYGELLGFTTMTFGNCATSRSAAGCSKRTAPQSMVVTGPFPPCRIVSYRSLTCSRGKSNSPVPAVPKSLVKQWP
jgi:hypothetical protein